MPSASESLRHNAFLWILGFSFSVLTDANTSQPFLYSCGILATLLVITGVLSVNHVYKPVFLLLLLINSPDITQSASDVDTVGTLQSATVWQIEIGIFRPTFVFTSILTYLCLSIKPATLPKAVSRFLLYFLTVPIITMIGYGYLFNSPVSAIFHDAKLPILIALSFYYFYSYSTNFNNGLTNVITAAFWLILGRLSVDFMYYCMGASNTYISGINRVSVDSGKVLIVPMVLVMVHNVVSGRHVISSLFVMVCAILVAFAYHTRSLLLLLAVGLILLFILFPIKAILKPLVMFCSVSAMALFLFPDFIDSGFGSSLGRFNFTVDQSVNSIFYSMDPIRYISFANAGGTMTESLSWLWGMGYGSWYSDERFPFPSDFTLASAFSAESVSTGRYYRIHDAIAHITFKFGLFGLCLYIMCAVTPVRELFQKHGRDRIRLSASMSVLLVSTPALMLYLFWSTKGAALLGALLAALYASAREIPHEGHPADTHI